MKLRRRDVPQKSTPEPKPVSHAGEVSRRVEHVVTQIKKQLADIPGKSPVSYEFEIIRDAKGMIKKIIARPLLH